jgi:hypothetical protein
MDKIILLITSDEFPSKNVLRRNWVYIYPYLNINKFYFIIAVDLVVLLKSKHKTNYAHSYTKIF